jgi:hypothetical protein
LRLGRYKLVGGVGARGGDREVGRGERAAQRLWRKKQRIREGVDWIIKYPSSRFTFLLGKEGFTKQNDATLKSIHMLLNAALNSI